MVHSQTMTKFMSNNLITKSVVKKICKSRELQGLTVELENSLCYKYNFLHFHEQL